MTALPPGPELDERLGRLLGWTKPSERGRCDVCGWPVVPNDEPGCWASNCSMRPMPHRRADDPAPYSRRIELAISAAEEAMKARRITDWNVGAYATGFCMAVVVPNDGGKDFAPRHHAATPAHALSLALCAALER